MKYTYALGTRQRDELYLIGRKFLRALAEGHDFPILIMAVTDAGEYHGRIVCQMCESLPLSQFTEKVNSLLAEGVAKPGVTEMYVMAAMAGTVATKSELAKAGKVEVVPSKPHEPESVISSKLVIRHWIGKDEEVWLDVSHSADIDRLTFITPNQEQRNLAWPLNPFVKLAAARNS